MEKKIIGETAKYSKVFDEFSKSVKDTLKESSSSIEKRFTETEKIIDSLDEDITDEFGKSIQQINTKIDSIKTAQDKDRKEIKDEQKLFVKLPQVKNLIEDLNKEFDSVKDHLGLISKDVAQINKIAATKTDVSENIIKTDKKLQEFQKQISQVESNSATREEIDDVLDQIQIAMDKNESKNNDKFKDISARLDQIRVELEKNSKDHSKSQSIFEQELKSEIDSLTSHDEFHEELDTVAQTVEKLSNDIKKIQKEMAFVSEIDDINDKVKKNTAYLEESFVSRKEFNQLRSLMEEVADSMDDKEEFVAKAKEIKATKKFKPSIDDNRFKPVRRTSKLGLAGNTLIGIAFAILITAIVLFFAGLPGLTDRFAIGAVVCFIVGIILRVVYAFRE
jgi:DNA repair exonuclease SbcCD ATPase subunit